MGERVNLTSRTRTVARKDAKSTASAAQNTALIVNNGRGIKKLVDSRVRDLPIHGCPDSDHAGRAYRQ